MNLLKERWIPVIRKSGKEELITPAEITNQYETDPIAFLNAPRPDFNGALMQFLIGLLQTAFSPEFCELDNCKWREWYRKPPSSDDLEKLLQPLLPAFEFDGEGARFMQDLELSEGEVKNIDALLLETPGDNTLKKNGDHFIKRALISGICRSCSCAALFNLQIHAPSGGRGYNTSLRGGGPLVTLISEKISSNSTLWSSVWLNILATNEFNFPYKDFKQHSLFPWLAKTITSENDFSIAFDDIHPMQVFWSMPRRIRLNFSELQDGNCDICGCRTNVLITKYITKNYGIKYNSENFRHPLSPYYRDKKKNVYLPKHLQPDGLGYKHWLAIALNGEEQESAKVVNRFSDNANYNIWAFGYDTDNMKVRCFYESYFPISNIIEQIKKEFAGGVEQFIKAASLVLSYARIAIKEAWFQSVKSASGNININKEFWSNTESDFYKTVEELKSILEKYNAIRESAADGILSDEQNDQRIKEQDELREKWLGILAKEAFALFNRWVESAGIEQENMHRIGIAHNNLIKNLNGAKLQTTLGKVNKENKVKKNGKRNQRNP